MKTLLAFLLLTAGRMYAQSTALTSVESARQAMLLNLIGRANNMDSTSLYDTTTYYDYFDNAFSKIRMPPSSYPPRQRTRQQRQTDHEEKVNILLKDLTQLPNRYCTCRNYKDIQVLPARFFKQSHPSIYTRSLETDWLPKFIVETTFVLFCPDKRDKRRRQPFAIAQFMNSSKILMLIRSTREEHE